MASSELAPLHPIRLGLTLNYPVHNHEILNSPQKAHALAEKTLDDAIGELDTASEESGKDM